MQPYGYISLLAFVAIRVEIYKRFTAFRSALISIKMPIVTPSLPRLRSISKRLIPEPF